MVNGDAQFFFCIAFQLRICKLWKAFLGSGKGFCRFLEVHTVNLVTDHHGFATLGVILFVQQHSFVSHRVEKGWLELLGVSRFSWMTCAGTKSLIVLESEDLIVPTYSATRLIFFHKEMSSLRQIAALPCFIFTICSHPMLFKVVYFKHIDAQRNTFSCRPAWQICWLGLRKMTLQSGAQPAFCRAESKAIQSCYMRAEYPLWPVGPNKIQQSYPSFQVLVLINFICMVLRYLEMVL